jgi:FkbM family methyltransferase
MIVTSEDSVSNFDEEIRFCSVPWHYAPRIEQYDNKTFPKTVCCHMPHTDRSGNMRMHTEFVNKSIGEIFNSEFYWNIRAGLLDGSLGKDACQDCQNYRMTQWTFEQLKELESALNAVESSLGMPPKYAPFIELREGRHGHMLLPLKHGTLGPSIEEHAESGKQEVELFAKLVKPGAIVLDVGANIGNLTVPLAQMVGSDGVVVAFEPEPTLHKILCANLVLNSIPNVITYAMVLGPCEGECDIPAFNPMPPCDFWGRPSEAAEERETVPVAKLDDFQLERVDFIRLDVDGFESEVLEGAAETIQRNHPVLYINQGQRETPDKLMQRLVDLNYRLWWHTLPPLSPDGADGNPGSALPGALSSNLLAIHRDQPPVEGLREVLAAKVAMTLPA